MGPSYRCFTALPYLHNFLKEAYVLKHDEGNHGRPDCTSRSAGPTPSPVSTCTSRPARCTASSAPTAPASPPTIRVLLGLLRADSGTARLLGRDPWADAVELHRRIAYVPGDVTLWRNLSGGEVIDLYGRLRGGLDAARRADLIDRFELDPTKKGRTYSKGNRQKVALVAAFASDVDLLILDEPTSGLDPLMEAVFQQLRGGGARHGAGRCCSPPTSSARSRSSATA